MKNISYSPRKKLGSGSFGDVYLLGSDKHAFAFKKASANIRSVECVKNEAVIYMQLSHPNIVNLDSDIITIDNHNFQTRQKILYSQQVIDSPKSGMPGWIS